MSYDYSFPETQLAQFNNNRKVGTVNRKFIQSGNNSTSGYMHPQISINNPAMGGESISGGESLANKLVNKL